jgi:DNA repair protein RecO (recombination protein O)
MIESASGIVLRARLLTETSLIIHWLTADRGRIATVAKGARRSKSPFAGKLDIFYLADFSYSRSRSSDLHNLREASLREPHRALREDLFKLQQAAYAAAMVEQATETETPLPEIFALMLEFLGLLCRQPPQAQNALAFELKLLHELGLEPDVAESHLSGGSIKLLQALMELGWEAGTRLKLSADQFRELRQFLHGFIIQHLGRLPRGRSGALGETI